MRALTMAEDSIPSDSLKKPVREGILWKKGQINRSWKKRYFVLYEGRRLAYYEKQDDFFKSKNPVGEIDLSSVQAVRLIPTLQEYQKQQQQPQSSFSQQHPPPEYTNISDLYSSISSIDNGGMSGRGLLKGSNTALADGGSTEEVLTLRNNNNYNTEKAATSPSSKKKNTSTTTPSSSSTSTSSSVLNYVDKEYAFGIITAKRTFVLCANDNFELHSWRNAIEKAAFGGRLHQGWLTKRGAMRKSWKKRWFVMFDTNEMRYYDNDQNMHPMGLIKLHEVLLICPGDTEQYTLPYTIQLLTPERNWVMATETQEQRDEWLLRLKEAIDGAKQLITSHEGYMWKKTSKKSQIWRKRYFAMSKGWLFYFDNDFRCQKFKSIIFFSEAFFQQAVQMYVKGNISLHETIIQKVNPKELNYRNNNNDNDNNNSNLLYTSTMKKEEEEEEIDSADMIDNGYKEHVFQISTNDRKYYFACDDEKQLRGWFKAFFQTHSEGFMSQSPSEFEQKVDNENIANVEIRLKSNNNDISRDVIGHVNTDDDDFEEDLEQKNANISTKEENTSTTIALKDHSTKKVPRRTEDNSPYHENRKSLFHLLDPDGTGKWRDLEDPLLIQAQPSLVKNTSQQSRQLV